MSRKGLSKTEMETIILWAEDTDTASIYTHDRRISNKLKELEKLWPEQFFPERKSSQGAVTYTIPKRCVGIRPPYREERKKKQALDAKVNGLPFLCKKNAEGI